MPTSLGIRGLNCYLIYAIMKAECKKWEAALFRTEKKFIINDIQKEKILMKIGTVCKRDEHTDDKGQYNIRSLYFDDYRDSGFHANEMGVEPRSKWRIRIYNHNARLIRLEQKIKFQGLIRKDSAVVSEEFCRRLLEDADQIQYPVENNVVNRFLTDCFTRGLCPRVIVEYDREPYVYEEGNVRITFDKAICCSAMIDEFFSENVFLNPVMRSGQQLLEVKYSEFLPGFLHQMLDTEGLQQSTFSKYYLCRRMG